MIVSLFYQMLYEETYPAPFQPRQGQSTPTSQAAMLVENSWKNLISSECKHGQSICFNKNCAMLKGYFNCQIQM